MYPAFFVRSTISTTARACRGSVVRMKSSWLIPSRSQACANTVAILSTQACGLRPASAAGCKIVCECSSIPMTKWTSSAQSRR